MCTKPALALLLTLLTACGGAPTADDPPSTSPRPSDGADESPGETEEPQASPTPTDPPARGTRVVVGDSEFGPMLFDAAGQAIYLFDVETTSEPRCYDACAEAWPPVLTARDPVAGRGVTSSLLATTKRSDGTLQVSYAGHPLYYYAHESEGEVKCHDVFLNGGNWYVVQPSGDAAPPV